MPAIYELTNSFHNTRTYTRFSPEERENIGFRVYSHKASSEERASMRRCKRALCGSPDCTCSNEWGER